MNWGNSIALTFILFAAFIGYMVVKAFQQDFDLVAEDYYAKEIAYQQKMDKLAVTAKDQVAVKMTQTEGTIRLHFSNEAKGEIYFYHPSRKIFDKRYAIILTDDLQQEIDKSELVAGNYRVNINWNVNGTEYLQESSIYIQ